jgi:hypothetical protein
MENNAKNPGPSISLSRNDTSIEVRLQYYDKHLVAERYIPKQTRRTFSLFRGIQKLWKSFVWHFYDVYVEEETVLESKTLV